MAEARARSQSGNQILPDVLVFALLMFVCSYALDPVPALADVPFTLMTIDPGQAPHGENLADLDGDGFLDVIVTGGNVIGEAVNWYRYPSWTKFQLGPFDGWDGLQPGDMNNDGAVDVVVNGGPTVWYENPRGSGGNPQGTWTSHTIDPDTRAHDLALADVNGDGKRDVLSRVSDGPTYLYLQVGPDSWTRVPMPNAEVARSGSALADINRDGRIDIVENGYWLEQPPDPVSGTWIKHVIGTFSSCSVAVGDLNGDGRVDVTLAPSEVGVGTIAWFEAPVNPVTGSWIRHDIDTAQDVHGHHLVDLDKDGDLDIVFAEMHQSNTRRVGVYWNHGAGSSFTIQILATTGSHNIAVGDVDRDGDLDILGANWDVSAPDGGDVRLWRNDLIVTGAPEREPSGPVRIVSLGCQPNPFQNQTEIAFRVEGGHGTEPVSLRIYDVHGRLLRTLLEGTAPARSTVPWDAMTDSGKRAGAGIYYYQLETGVRRLTRRLVLLK